MRKKGKTTYKTPFFLPFFTRNWSRMERGKMGCGRWWWNHGILQEHHISPSGYWHVWIKYANKKAFFFFFFFFFFSLLPLLFYIFQGIRLFPRKGKIKIWGWARRVRHQRGTSFFISSVCGLWGEPDTGNSLLLSSVF